MKNNEKGRSMIEMLGVLSVVGVLSMSAISLYSKAMHTYDVSALSDQVSELIANIRNACYSRRNCSSVMPQNWKKEDDTKKLVPEKMWNRNKTAIKHALGGGAEISACGGGGVDHEIESCQDLCNSSGKAFTVKIKTLDRQACIKLATSHWGPNVCITINGNDDSFDAFPASSAKNKCSDDNDVTFTVK